MSQKTGVIVAVALSLTSLPSLASADGTAVVLPAQGEGVDQVVLQLLTSALRDRVQARGYRLLDAPAALVPGAALEDAARGAARGASATIGVAARVAVPAPGRYRLTIVSASPHGRAWTAEDQSAGADVLSLLERLFATAVPEPGEAGTAPPPVASEPPIVPSGPSSPGGLPPIVSNGGTDPGLPPIVSNAPDSPPVTADDSALIDQGYDTMQLRRVRQRRIPRVMLGVVTESCVGINRTFYNHLIGPRVQLALTQSFLAFAVAEYAYYGDDPGFGLVAHAGIEGRVRLGQTGRNGMPFRVSLGYAPENGGVMKLEMGLQLYLSKKVDVVLVPLAPTIWFLEGGNAVSMNFGLEIDFGV